jgi:hypothetical protein
MDEPSHRRTIVLPRRYYRVLAALFMAVIASAALLLGLECNPGVRFHFRDPPDYNEGDHPTWGRSEATKRF